MRKIRIQSALLIVVLISLIVFSKRTLAQSTDGWKEMVLGLSPLDNIVFEKLLPVIYSMPGISYRGFCAEHKCLLILFDPAVHTGEQQLTKAFAERKTKVFPKGNTTFEMITAECIIITPIAIDEE